MKNQLEISPRRSDLQQDSRQPAIYRSTNSPRPRLASRDGLVYGLHAVAAALSNPSRRLRRLLLTEEASTALVANYKQPWPITPERVERERLDQLLGRNTVHQGVALLADILSISGACSGS